MDCEHFKEREEALLRELEEFKLEKERVRQVIGSIGGDKFSKKHTVVNVIFLVVIVAFFILALLMDLNFIPHYIPPYFSLEISVLLVSLKVVWMIHSQQKIYHFQFWILSSIEFRINEIVKNIREIEKATHKE